MLPANMKWTSLTAFVFIVVMGTAFQAQAGERSLAFPVRGVVAEVLVSAGKTVAKGAPLARLDPRPFKAHLDSAQAGLKSAEKVLGYALQNRNDVRQLFDDLSTSGEALEKAEIRLAKAEAALAKAKAYAEIAAWEMEKATLRAPAPGTVKALRGYAGMVVDPRAGITPVIILSTK